MSAHSFSPFPACGAPGAALSRLRDQFGPLLLIAAAHALVLYGVYSGLLHRVVQSAMPAEVVVSFVATPPPPVPQLAPPAAIPTLAPPSVTIPVTVFSIAPAQPIASAAAPAAAEPAAPVPIPAPPAAPRTITSGVAYLKPPQPDYPAVSRRMGEQGKVVLRILVSDQGLPEQVLVQTSSGFERLDEAGRQAALRAQFKPHLEDGRPVAVYVIVPLTFQLG